MEESPEDADLFIDKQQESEAAFWRIKKAIDDWRDNRIKRVMAQEGEGVFRRRHPVVRLGIEGGARVLGNRLARSAKC